ncbi:MAG: MFS transporter [Sphingopyxis sp.]|nr:MFS transporter [Sphingopyxis sp.]
MKPIGSWGEGDWVFAIALVVLTAFVIAGAMIAGRKTEEVAGHPRGLYVLFFAEMWERFSYYGMRAILVFYLVEHWDFTEAAGNGILGAYASLVYITPVLGGWLADRYLGQRKAVIFGGVLLAIGHILMAVEGDGGQNNAQIGFLWAALAFIIVGSGFLKANISVIVGQLYPMTDKRRDGAYTLFYMGINSGAAIGTILVGYLGQTVGWAYGFGLAGIGMVVGLLVFIAFKPLLLGKGEAPDPQALKAPTFGISLENFLYVIGLLSVAVIWGLIQYRDVIQMLLLVSGIALLGYVLFEAFKLEKVARERMFAILFLIALNPLFWGLFEQAGGSLNQYTKKFVDIGGVPASLFQSINPIYIMIFAPIFAWFWITLARKNMEPSAPAKFGLALLQVGAGFLLFVWGAATFGVTGANQAGVEVNLTPVIFVFLIYLLHTTGELCLSPVGLSAMTRLAPGYLASLIMGAWFYMTAVGNFVAGKIGEATGGEEGEMVQAKTLAIYDKIGWVAIGVGVVVLLLSPLVKRWMHLDKLSDGDDLAGNRELGEPLAAGVHPEPKGA